MYSEVQQSKVVGEPSEMIQVKERGKILCRPVCGCGKQRRTLAEVELHSMRISSNQSDKM